jgi:phage terminase small subunit
MQNGQGPVTEEEITLTGKQKKFAEFYVGECNFNATKAAIAAGYSEKTAYSIGHENLRKPEIRFYIEKRLAETTLTRNEVLARLTAIATGSVEDVSDDEGNFDFKIAKRTGKLPLIKKIKVKDGDIEFEMYSAHEALRDLGKYHNLFVERHEIKSTVSAYIMSKDEWERDTANKLGQVSDQLEKFDDDDTTITDPDA